MSRKWKGDVTVLDKECVVIGVIKSYKDYQDYNIEPRSSYRVIDKKATSKGFYLIRDMSLEVFKKVYDLPKIELPKKYLQVDFSEGDWTPMEEYDNNFHLNSKGSVSNKHGRVIKIDRGLVYGRFNGKRAVHRLDLLMAKYFN